MAKPTKKKPFYSFRLYLGKQFYHVVIFDTRDIMQKTFEIVNGYSTEPESLAVTQQWTVIRIKNKHEKVGMCIGRIWFSKEHLGGGLIAHEMTHAALFWAQANGRIKELIHKPKYKKGAKAFLAHDTIDELIPFHVGELCRKFYNKMYELKIWKQ